MGMFLLAGIMLWPALLWAGPSADAQESPTCDQYSTCEKGLRLEATVSTSASVAPEEGALERMASASTSPQPPPEPDNASPPESAAPATDGTPPQEAGSLAVEDGPIGVSASASAGSSASAAPTNPADSPPPVVPPTTVASLPSAGGPVASRDEATHAELARESEMATGEADPPEGTGEREAAQEPPEARDRPITGYPYDGETCEDRHCGMENIEGPAECAAYETASGQTVYGCADPALHEKKDCYDLTFYTERGEPYSNLNTCKGEKPYGPPEPPDGPFDYWEPPAGVRPAHTAPDELILCENPRGDIDWSCGLDVPKKWYCGIFYGTVHGTVRACDINKGEGIEGYRVYDEAGRLLGIYPAGGGLNEEECGRDNCGARLDLPPRFECQRLTVSYGPLWAGASSKAWIECEDRRRVEMVENGELFDPSRICVYVFDEDGRLKYKKYCHPDGGASVGEQAGDDAEGAEETLNGAKKPPSPVGPGSGTLGSVAAQLLGKHQGGNESGGWPHEPPQGGNPQGGLTLVEFEGSPELTTPRPEAGGADSGPPPGSSVQGATPAQSMRAQAAPEPHARYYLARGNAADGEKTDSAKGSSPGASGTGAGKESTGGSLLSLLFRPIADSVLPGGPAVPAVEWFVPDDAPSSSGGLRVNATVRAQSRTHDGRSPVLADAAGPAERSASASSPSAGGSAEIPPASPGPALGTLPGAGSSETDRQGGLRVATGSGDVGAAPGLRGRAAEGFRVGHGRTYGPYGGPALLLGGLGSVAVLYTAKRRSWW